MKPILSIAILAAAMGADTASAEIYRVVDESGRVTFTDRPPADQTGASRVDLRTPNTHPAPVLPVADNNSDTETSGDDGFTGYQRVAIAQPRHNDTIPPGQREVTVQVITEPALQPGHLVQVLYDGKPVAPPAATDRVRIAELVRGTHQIRAQVLDAQRRVLVETGTIDIHVKRASILNRPKGQNAPN